MSVNSKLRNLAALLPYFPRTDSSGNLVVTYNFIMGVDLLKKDPEAKDNAGKPIIAKVRYRQAIVLGANHFEELKKAYKSSGEEGVRQYSEMVKAYQAQSKQKTDQAALRKV